MTVSEMSLRNVFMLAEERLRGDSNDEVMEAIANDARRASYEGSLNRIIHLALSEVFEDCYIYSAGQPRELHSIDICVVQNNDVVAAIESKGTVANSHNSDIHRSAIDLHGIRTKLWHDKRSQNSIQNDIKDISQKIPQSMSSPRFEVFVPIIYELYREGGNPSVWFSERKPWVTLPKFRDLRVRLKDDLEDWFYSQDPQINLLHATEFVELRGANEYWSKTSKAKYPQFTSLKAYVSFYAFTRFVE
ncbi:MAG: hypothetical protein F4Y50_04245 [Dehalococcoidia bacterium]|nr:hypothetical protein [Dehalococcoidia bacterium]